MRSFLSSVLRLLSILSGELQVRRYAPALIDSASLERDSIGMLIIDGIRTVTAYSGVSSAIRELPELKVIFIGNLSAKEINDLMGLGVCGFLSEPFTREQLQEAVHGMNTDGVFVPSSWTRRVLKGIRDRRQQRSIRDLLSDRESEIMREIASGLADKEIAARLGISIHTVKQHLKDIYRKWGVNCRTLAAVIWTRDANFDSE